MKLEHARKGCERSSSHRFLNTTRAFFKLASGAVLATGLMVAPMVFPKAARAQDATTTATARQKQIQNLNVTQLDKPLSQLETETSRIAVYQRVMTDGKKFTCQSTSVQTNDVNFIVDLTTMKLGVVFYPQLDDSTRGAGAGTRGVDLHDFAKMVENQTGKKLEGVKIVLETGTFMYKGKETQYTNAYILPIDAQGKITTALGAGKYFIYGASYYADNHVAGEPAILMEPNGTYSLSLSMAVR